MVPPTETGTEWDGTINPPNTGDYAAAVDQLVNDMPQATEGEAAHTNMMHDPAYAIATHEHQLNKIANLLEELCARVVSIEQKINQHETDHLAGNSDNPINDYPEVTMHGGAPGLTQ